ncbi:MULTISPECIES: folate-binding protein YgfZ [Rhodomicrobium]|uniref:CAF17-like 4Fe-4S cluster assembly/insertion protein YgfZ n=1 Tax=Rhodomicrobium TaxID=1068 RepID=UPI000B4AF1C7|nr:MULTISPECIES: folate-binding protein YgfZ [Rhodomicrobium]
MSYSQISLLPDRGVIELRGPEAASFLSGLVTNDVERAEPGQAVFAGLLTPQGKILFDFLIYVRDGETLWLDCVKEQAETLLKRLTMYRLRAKVELADRSAELAVAAAWGDEPREGNDAFIAAYADPRFAPLGERLILEADPGQPHHFGDRAGGDTLYHSHRVALAVPQGGLDYAYGESFPHEACYDDLHGVDFEKGCYVGQEVVSRMHHRGTAKTRIAAIEASAPLDLSGAEIRAGEFPVGTLGSMDGTRGIAMVRLDRIDEAARHGIPLRVGEVTLTASRPAWASYDVPAGGVRA